ncbi:MAG TPA: FGGY family carbohydrate kinase [Chitinophagaceae bacterium]|nr:FGGY family carbohydrate kinase [Chitinophagaceae bacterium]
MSSRVPVIVIFDVGKTNKKIFLFDEDYKIVHEQTVRLEETKDEDGLPCEDVFALTNWIKQGVEAIARDGRFEIKEINFSAYGASFVYLDEHYGVIPPLYNYLKPFPEPLLQKFYDTYGGRSEFSKATASPVLGNLNSGMQLYRLKHEKPEVFERIKYALHLPQYLSFLLTASIHSDITSIGCHTNLWNFQESKYHRWVEQEGLREKLPEILSYNAIAGYWKETVPIGVGLHDSSAALVPYLLCFNEPFILLSTGTWCITLNPFNHSMLSDQELQQDCLCYLSHQGKPVKASRLFAGYEHEQQLKKLATHFNVEVERYKELKIDFDLVQSVKAENERYHNQSPSNPAQSQFPQRDLNEFSSYEQAYHQLIGDIIAQQIISTDLVLRGTSVRRIFVDGGFSNNSIYMHMLADAFPGMEVYAAFAPQASALGAALVLHQNRNAKHIPLDIIKVTRYWGRSTPSKERT